VKINCSLISSSSYRRAGQDWGYFWISVHAVLPSTRGYCEKIFSSLKSGEKRFESLKKQLIDVGCRSFKNIEMCKRYSKPHYQEAFVNLCNADGDGNPTACETFSLDFNQGEQKEFCLKNRISATCVALGGQFAKSKDHENASLYYKEACSLGDAWACGDAGFHLSKLSKIADSKRYFEMACGKKVYHSCMRLGLVLKDLGQDKEASEVFHLACNEGSDGPSCEFFAYSSKNQKIKYQYFMKARQIYLAGCNAGQNYNCTYLIKLTETLREMGLKFSE
jgi:hypothetical protein